LATLRVVCRLEAGAPKRWRGNVAPLAFRLHPQCMVFFAFLEFGISEFGIFLGFGIS
jgi:hypothetical protein